MLGWLIYWQKLRVNQTRITPPGHKRIHVGYIPPLLSTWYIEYTHLVVFSWLNKASMSLDLCLFPGMFDEHVCIRYVTQPYFCKIVDEPRCWWEASQWNVFQSHIVGRDRCQLYSWRRPHQAEKEISMTSPLSVRNQLHHKPYPGINKHTEDCQKQYFFSVILRRDRESKGKSVS